MSWIPDFTSDGVLPEGDHPATLEDLRAFVRGHDWSADGLAWRLQLLGNLEIVVNQLYAVGLEDIWIDGSFVEAKDTPGDIDAYVDVPRGEHQAKREALNIVSGSTLWTTKPFITPGLSQPKMPLWHEYQVEMFIVDVSFCLSVPEPLRDRLVPVLFRSTKLNAPKGIVKLKRKPAC